jgi:hypothetical protein
VLRVSCDNKKQLLHDGHRTSTETYDSGGKVHVEPTWFRRMLLSNLFEVGLKIYNRRNVSRGSPRHATGKEEKRSRHFLTVFTSLLLFPKLGTCVRTRTPARSFCSSRSHLFKKRMICVFASIWREHSVCHSMYVSSSRLTRRSSRRRSSNDEIGARKMMAFMSSKYGYQ